MLSALSPQMTSTYQSLQRHIAFLGRALDEVEYRAEAAEGRVLNLNCQMGPCLKMNSRR